MMSKKNFCRCKTTTSKKEMLTADGCSVGPSVGEEVGDFSVVSVYKASSNKDVHCIGCLTLVGVPVGDKLGWRVP